MDDKVILYTTHISSSPNIQKEQRNLRTILQGFKIQYKEIDLSVNPEKKQNMIAVSKHTYLPQLHINGTSLGKFSEIQDLIDEGEFESTIEKYLNQIPQQSTATTATNEVDEKAQQEDDIINNSQGMPEKSPRNVAPDYVSIENKVKDSIKALNQAVLDDAQLRRSSSSIKTGRQSSLKQGKSGDIRQFKPSKSFNPNDDSKKLEKWFQSIKEKSTNADNIGSAYDDEEVTSQNRELLSSTKGVQQLPSEVQKDKSIKTSTKDQAQQQNSQELQEQKEQVMDKNQDLNVLSKDINESPKQVQQISKTTETQNTQPLSGEEIQPQNESQQLLKQEQDKQRIEQIDKDIPELVQGLQNIAALDNLSQQLPNGTTPQALKSSFQELAQVQQSQLQNQMAALEPQSPRNNSEQVTISEQGIPSQSLSNKATPDASPQSQLPLDLSQDSKLPSKQPSSISLNTEMLGDQANYDKGDVHQDQNEIVQKASAEEAQLQSKVLNQNNLDEVSKGEQKDKDFSRKQDDIVQAQSPLQSQESKVKQSLGKKWEEYITQLLSERQLLEQDLNKLNPESRQQSKQQEVEPKGMESKQKPLKYKYIQKQDSQNQCRRYTLDKHLSNLANIGSDEGFRRSLERRQSDQSTGMQSQKSRGIRPYAREEPVKQEQETQQKQQQQKLDINTIVKFGGLAIFGLSALVIIGLTSRSNNKQNLESSDKKSAKGKKHQDPTNQLRSMMRG